MNETSIPAELASIGADLGRIATSMEAAIETLPPPGQRKIGLCVDCRFWEPPSEAEVELARRQRVKSRGECRIRAPGCATHGEDYSVYVAWPRPEATDWCAEYEPREGAGGR